MAAPAAVPYEASEVATELRGCATLDLADGTALSWLVPPGVAAHWQARPTIWPLPGAAGALRGVTYWLGRLAPVFDIGQWLAPHPASVVSRDILLLGLPGGPAALRVRGAPRLVHVEVAGRVPTAAQVPAAALQPFLRPRRLLEGDVVYEFAVQSWLEHVRTRAATAATGAKEEA